MVMGLRHEVVAAVYALQLHDTGLKVGLVAGLTTWTWLQVMNSRMEKVLMTNEPIRGYTEQLFILLCGC